MALSPVWDLWALLEHDPLTTPCQGWVQQDGCHHFGDEATGAQQSELNRPEAQR